MRNWSGRGLQVLERNWRCRLGEIDIIAAEVGDRGLTLLFCEVKCRSGLGFDHLVDAITYAKMRTLRQLAALWMREHHVKASTIRLDAIGVVLWRAGLADPRESGGLSGVGLRVVRGTGRPSGADRGGGGRHRRWLATYPAGGTA